MNNTANEGIVIPPHPINLVQIDVVNLYFANNVRPSLKTEIEPSEVLLYHMPGGFNKEQKSFITRARASYGVPDPNSQTDGGVEPDMENKPCSFLIEIMGIFVVQDERITEEIIEKFQHLGALASLTPYLREHVFAMSARAGIKPIILPLSQVPIIRVSKDGSLSNT